MKLFYLISHSIRYNLKKLIVNYQTYRFDREIKRAYGVSRFPFLFIHPVKVIVLPVLTASLIVTLMLLPKPKTPVSPAVFPVRENPVVTEEAANPAKKPKTVSGKFLHALIADKDKQALTLFKFFSSNDLLFVQSYAVGEHHGGKQRFGDIEIPEGLCWISHMLDDDEHPPVDKVRAFGLGYPNTRGLIGILEMRNRDFNRVSKFIGIGTPILIIKSAPSPKDSIRKYFRWTELLKDRKEFSNKRRIHGAEQ
jgi:hypothetical protein